MEIKSIITDRAGQVFNVIYRDLESLEELGNKEKDIFGVAGFCFYGDKMVIVYSEKKGYWGHPSGGREAGETIDEALTREVCEETNMRIISRRIIGYQEIFEPEKVVVQTRHLCIVEPIGPFVADPDEGEITEIKLIDPNDLKKYVDWGKVGEHILKRTMEIKKTCERLHLGIFGY
jgi:8-oxo-dGTP pyrophosphatase MutT (NUDIX family)